MIIDWLLERMTEFEDRSAMVCANETVSYGDLLEGYGVWAERLRDYGLLTGEVVALEGDYSPAMAGAVLACMANGNIVVPLTAEVSHKREEFLGIAEAHVSVTVRGGEWTAERLYHGEPANCLLKKLTASGNPGLILFTSGSTGAPKAILHDLARFLERYKKPRETLRTLTFLLFDHIGGFNTLFHTLSNGGTIIPPSSRRPDDICSLMEKHRVELLPTSPSFLNLLLISEAYARYDLSSLRMITYGTEVMPDWTLRHLREALPQVELRQTYGLSELGILRTKTRESGSPWMTVGGEGIETRIEDGLLHIRSRWAMLGYLNAPDPIDKDGWMNTQDEVVTDGDFIRILGRRSEIINVGGRKVYPMEVENVLLFMPELADVVVKGEMNPLLGQAVTAFVKPACPLSARELKERIRLYCRGRLEDYQIPVKVYLHDQDMYNERFKKIRK
ncbi:MAG: AMP-dependent synthetase and ligase [Paenibacillaceae bacterium]|jgi:acyl-coenzyme A synthetase/AMP-(fatty) acid ligase|nr:AMP-dependent synthetase and ligase [Paenibacillaceae bacterium]